MTFLRGDEVTSLAERSNHRQQKREQLMEQKLPENEISFLFLCVGGANVLTTPPKVDADVSGPAWVSSEYAREDEEVTETETVAC